MYRIFTLTLFASLLSLPSLEFQTSRSRRSKRNRAPIIKSFDSSSWVIAICPFAPGGACAATGTRIRLAVNAEDPEDDQLTYQYTVSKGVIEGSGSIVNWDLNGTFGPQTATVEVTDRRGGRSSSVARVRVVPCDSCDPPCTILEVSCPTSVREGETALFEARISGDIFGKQNFFGVTQTVLESLRATGPNSELKRSASLVK